MSNRTWHKRRFAKTFTREAFAVAVRAAAERQRREREGRRHRMRLEQRAERLVGHRELQLVRALATNNPHYIEQRERKLNAARSQLQRLKEPWPNSSRRQATT